jgi:hypothetical protein
MRFEELYDGCVGDGQKEPKAAELAVMYEGRFDLETIRSVNLTV